MVATTRRRSGESEDVRKSENPEDYAARTAEIPEWRPDRDPMEEYAEVDDDVKIWSPISESYESSIPLFMYVARSALTYAQVRQGVPDNEAMENSCSGHAEQYISDVLYDSGFLAQDALKTLMTKQIPHKVSERWTPLEMSLFEQGLVLYRKNFTAIRRNILPYKTTMDIVELYYTWKRSKQVKGVAASQARAFLRRRQKRRSATIGSPVESAIVTRGYLLAKEKPDTPARDFVSRKDVYTGVKRRRRLTKRARLPSVEL